MQSAFGVRMDVTSIVTTCTTAVDARSLAPGSIVGDTHGGLTFTDEVAAVLESRSLGGWPEIEMPSGDRWTIILLNH
jgi:hypothetical protein